MTSPAPPLDQPDAATSRLIVYVEDNPQNVAFMEDLIGELQDVQLLTASTAELGIELIRARHPSLVLMDIHLPGLDGFEATRRLRAAPDTCDIPVIGISAAGRMHEPGRIAAAGFHSYFDKPVNVDALLSALESVLSTAPPSPDLATPRH